MGRGLQLARSIPRLNSCETETRADHPTFLPRGGLGTPIDRDDDVVCGEGMEMRRWLGNALRCVGAAGSTVNPILS